MRERSKSYAHHLISSALGDACAKGMHYKFISAHIRPIWGLFQTKLNNIRPN